MNTFGRMCLAALLYLSLHGQRAFAHCDGMDGPVVKAAQTALESKNVNLVLAWVQKADEPQIREAFTKTLEVRKLGPAAQEVADRYFFETLVRVHRAGEGAPYTGLKPSGRDIGPAIAAADKALESGSSKEALHLLSDAVAHGIRERFNALSRSQHYDKNNPEGGREYVRRYVAWIHYVNGVYQAAVPNAVNHEEEGAHREHAD